MMTLHPVPTANALVPGNFGFTPSPPLPARDLRHHDFRLYFTSGDKRMDIRGNSDSCGSDNWLYRYLIAATDRRQ